MNASSTDLSPSPSDTAPDAGSNINANSAAGDRVGTTDQPKFAGNQGRGPHVKRGHYPSWYHGNWHDHWDHPWYARPAAWWAGGSATGLAVADFATPWTWGYWPYYNPYYTSPVVVGDTTIDYSLPLAMAAPAVVARDARAAQPGGTPSPADRAMALLETARDAFTRGNYIQALVQCDQAIATRPQALLAHEFRGLTLFALGRYKEAASPIYAVVSMKPGWDWTTLCSLYADVDTYTEQLRALEHYVTANPNAIEARFLLVYHYMTSGHGEAAARQLTAVVQLSPKDRLSAELLRADDDGARAATGARGAGQARPSLHYRRRLESHSRRWDHHQAQPYEERRVHLGVRGEG